MREPRSRGRPKAADLASLEARIVHEASQLFFAKGYGHTTMSAVAAAAQVSKTTLYSRFPSKADLLRGIVARQTEDWRTNPEEMITNSNGGIRDLLLSYGDVALRAGLSADYVQVTRLLYGESGRFPELGRIAEDSMRYGIDVLAQEIGSRSEREELSCGDPQEIASMFLTLLSGRVSRMIVSNNYWSASERDIWLNEAVDLLLAAYDRARTRSESYKRL